MAVGSNAQQALENHELSFAKRGLWWGIISGATWGLDGVLLTIAGYMAPFWLEDYSIGLVIVACIASAAMHDLFAGGWVAIYNALTGRWSEYARSLKTKPGKIVLLAAIFGGPIGMGGYLIGLNLAGATYALSISAMYPAVGALLGVIFLKERITPRVWVGIIACMIGALIVSYSPPSGGEFPHFYLGIALSFLPVIGWAAEGVISTFGMDMVDSDIALGMREAFSGLVQLIVVIPLCGLLLGAGLSGWNIFGGAITAVTPMIWVAAAGLAGGLSYIAWYKALNMTGVGRAMAFNVTYALWSIPFGLLFAFLVPNLYTYSVSGRAVFGAAVITIGTLLVVANPKELLKLRN